MPTVSALLSGGVSVGLLAGVVSGLFYLVVAGIRWAGRLRHARGRLEAEERQRQAEGAASPHDGDHGVRRRRASCPDADREVKQQSGEWFYRQVQRRFHPALAAPPASAEDDGGAGMEAGSAQVRDFIERLVEALVAGDLDNVCIRRLHAHPDYDRMFACHHAPLCEALARLSFALQMAIANKPMAGPESPSAAHAALKHLIQQIIKEAQTLPDFKGLRHRGNQDDDELLEDMESKTYEDILATAILNKVIERYQENSAAGKAVDGNTNLLSPELMSLVAAHKPKFISSVKIGVNSPTSSDDGKSDRDSPSEVNQTDPLAVTIEECIEEVTTFRSIEDDDAEDLPGLDVFNTRRAPFPEYGRDIIDGTPLDMQDDTDEDEENDELEDDPSLQPTDMINPVDSWEENWLFQKRRLKVGGVPQPMSVPMLVPNPSEDYRALIGDRDAEDVSDLSECSDGALEDLVLADEDDCAEASAVPANDISVEDTQERNLVPQKSGVQSFPGKPEIDHELHGRENVEEKPIIPVSEAANGELLYNEADLAEAKNLEFLKTSEDCLSEFGQQEGEYTEDYAAVTQRQLDSLIGLSEPESSEAPELPTSPVPQKSPETSDIDETVVAILDKLVPSENASIENPDIYIELANPPRPGTELSDDDNLSQPPPGTIAEREHKKWETAPPLPNNPYSPENIYKRLSKKTPFSRMSSSSDISLEFPDLKDSPGPENIIEKPLQIICSPSEVDYKKYGRDYYINSQPTDGKKHQRNSSEHHQGKKRAEEDEEEPIENFIENELPQPVEKKVAQWQKEINNTDQYYKNVRNKNLDLPKKTYKDLATNGDSQVDTTAFMKSMLGISDDENDTNYSVSEGRKNINNMKEKYENLSKKRNDSYISDPDIMGNGRRENYETGSDTFSNGYARSDSPSGSSIVTSDSEHGMPSVRELRKRFTSLKPDSDSSVLRSKSVSPAPRMRPPDPLPDQMQSTEPILKSEQTEVNQKKPEQPSTQSILNPSRPVREIHSLTARSISKEFREELRHNHPVPLNRNVYKAGNQPCTNGPSSNITEEVTPADRATSKSPIPSRSMQSSIAFWEKLQKHNS